MPRCAPSSSLLGRAKGVGKRVLVTGAGGFIGSHLMARAATTDGVEFTWVVGRRGVSPPEDGRHRVLRADLRDERTVRGLADGADALIHLAHRVSGTPQELEEVNFAGTRTLLREAKRAGIEHIVGLSTLAVYGSGPFRGESITSLPLEPTSPTSQSRWRGDEIVLAAGGMVVRPHFVLGPGDVWVVPRAIEIVQRVGWVDGGRARHTVTSAENLAEDLLECALHGNLGPRTGSRRVRLPVAMQTVTVRQMLTPHLRGRRFQEIGLQEALVHPAGHGDHRWKHDVQLLATDHVVTS